MKLKDGALVWDSEDIRFIATEAIRRLTNRRKEATKRNLKREVARVVRRYLVERMHHLPSVCVAVVREQIDAQVEWFQKQLEHLGEAK